MWTVLPQQCSDRKRWCGDGNLCCAKLLLTESIGSQHIPPSACNTANVSPLVRELCRDKFRSVGACTVADGSAVSEGSVNEGAVAFADELRRRLHIWIAFGEPLRDYSVFEDPAGPSGSDDPNV